ncbi:hypothetical protein AB0I76_23070, partial [Micromonospora sp. NPDC049799]
PDQVRTRHPERPDRQLHLSPPHVRREAAVADLPVTVAYTNRPRPFDVTGLRALAGDAVILVEPYLAGTSARVVSAGLADRPHRLLALGVGREELRRYGTADDHTRWHGLDAAGLRRSVVTFLRPALVG